MTRPRECHDTRDGRAIRGLRVFKCLRKVAGVSCYCGFFFVPPPFLFFKSTVLFPRSKLRALVKKGFIKRVR